VAVKFEEAAKSYSANPTTNHLRAMNMLNEELKSNSTIVIVSATELESMQSVSPAGITAMIRV